MRRSALVAATLGALGACGRSEGFPAADSGFAALQERGQAAMGVDQYASAHVFEPLSSGGRIVLQMKESDPVGEATIRAHMRTIASAFAGGDFALPGFVHATGEVPGTAAMKHLSGDITYSARDLPRGGEVLLTTRNPDAVAAIHDFLAFQRKDHRAGKH